MQVILVTTDPQTTEADIAFEISLYLIHSLGSQRRKVPGWENIPSLSCSFSVTSITTSQIWHPCGTAQTSCVHLLLQFSPSIYGLTLRWYAIALYNLSFWCFSLNWSWLCRWKMSCFHQVSDLDDEASSPTEEFKAFVTDTGMNRSQSEYCNVGNKTYLTNHPAKKYVFDFMRVLIMDNLCMTPASKQTPIIDHLLEVRPSRISTWSHFIYHWCCVKLSIILQHFACGLLEANVRVSICWAGTLTLLCVLRPHQNAQPGPSRKSFSPTSWTVWWSSFWQQMFCWVSCIPIIRVS